jgi:hypothetical protein
MRACREERSIEVNLYSFVDFIDRFPYFNSLCATRCKDSNTTVKPTKKMRGEEGTILEA